MKFIHAADIHLDSPLQGLERYEGAPVEEIRGATRRALENLVQLCVDEEAAFLLIAGDLYDGEWRDYNTGLFFAKQARALRDAGVSVYLISGNHDAASVVAKQLQLPENVKVFPTSKADTLLLDELGVAIHGQGFARRDVTDDLSSAYPSPVAGYLNVGLLHTSADGREGHAPYAPCTVEGLVSRGYDYWALGHVHVREVLRAEPWVVFPGNLQGRHARETGGKGATVVTVDAGEIVSVEHRDLDVVRWTLCLADASTASSVDDVLESVSRVLREGGEQADGRLLAARIRIEGATAAHTLLLGDRERLLGEVRSIAADAGGQGAWVEKLELRTAQPGGVAPTVDEGQVSSLLDAVVSARREAAASGALVGALDELVRKLPGELREGDQALDFHTAGGVEALAAEAEALIISRLIGGETSA